jgi:hypothetical protein
MSPELIASIAIGMIIRPQQLQIILSQASLKIVLSAIL